MAKRQKQSSTSRQKSGAGGGLIRRAASAIRHMLPFGKSDVVPGSQTTAAAARVTRRQTDIPLDTLASTLTPPQTSNKAGFRSDGSDHHRDQEFAAGYASDRWNAEDRYTNHSGDPRIGTHGRSYEPGEAEAKLASDNE